MCGRLPIGKGFSEVMHGWSVLPCVRPVKPPKEGERVSLGLRVTPDMRRKLEKAALKSGRSLSQEVERRLDRSLDFDRHLVIAQGDFWAPVLYSSSKGEVWVGLGDDPRDYPVPEGAPPHEETLVVLTTSTRELRRLANYFGGAPWPYDHSIAEIEEEGQRWIQHELDIRRGK